MDAQHAFRAEVERYLSITGMKPTRFGMMAAGDPRFVFDLRRTPRELRSSTMKRVTAFMSQPVDMKRTG